MKFSLICQHCETPFTATRAATQRPPSFCSKACYIAASHRGGGTRQWTCESCGAQFIATRGPGRVARFCSQACYSTAGRSRRDKLDTRKPSSGRRAVTRKVNGRSVSMMRSRWVWNETHPNDPVGPDEHIHHVDGDPLNDDPANLQKLTADEHDDIHRTFKRPSSDALSRRMKAYHQANPGKQRRGVTKTCPVCGVEFYRPPSANAETCSYACMGKLRSMKSSTISNI